MPPDGPPRTGSHAMHQHAVVRSFVAQLSQADEANANLPVERRKVVLSQCMVSPPAVDFV